MKNLILTILTAFSLCSAGLPPQKAPVQEIYEVIQYKISPVGHSTYQDMGVVDFRGQKARLIIFKTNAPGFSDIEKIYSDLKTYLPIFVERDIAFPIGAEYITEEYNPGQNSLVITKFKRSKQAAKYSYKAKGPIHNAVLLPFWIRTVKDLEVGWTYTIRLPDEFKVNLVAIEEVSVPAGKFKAYHFTSAPSKFEIWISADSYRIPLKIKGMGGLSYALVMKERIAAKK